jgi:eukaryotic-like serine/threonine-protein kinase
MTAAAPTAGTLLDGVYVLQQPIGRGAAGQVWLAEDLALKRRCAVKIVPPELIGGNDDAWRNALRREATAMASLRHPNIAQVYAFGRHRDLHYFIMEWVDGETVAAEIERRRLVGQTMSLRRVLRVVAESCRGLAAVHKVGIVHRDIKPSNLMLSKDGRVVVIDFGLVRMPDGAGPGGAPVGTPRYMAPELARPTERPTPEELHLCDIYSLGATAYEMFTGSPPFPGEGAREVIQKHIYDAVEPPSKRNPELPPIIDRLLMRALAKRAVERYSSAEDFRAAVSAVAARLRTTGEVHAVPRVLIVDDDADFRTFVCTFVRRMQPDAFLYTAQDGDEALDVARRVQPHLAVLDLNMPAMNGFQLAEALAASPETARTRVVVVSGSAGMAEVRARFQRLGVVEVLEKPLRPQQLMEVVQSTIAA